MQSFDTPAHPPTDVSPWIARFGGLVPARSGVLDVACGHGRHARHFAALGHPVVAADIDTSGVSDLVDARDIRVDRVDLESGPWPYDTDAFGAIVVTNYLHRPHFDHYVASLADGGILMIDTFGAGNEALGRPRNPDHLLAPGELLDAFAHRLDIIAYEYGSETTPRPAVRQRLCAVKGHGPRPLTNDC